MSCGLTRLAVSVLALCTTSFSQMPTSAPVGRELFTKEIAPGQKIFIRSRQVDAKALGVLGADIVDQNGRADIIHADLQMSNGSTLLLAATGYREYPDLHQGFKVLDVFVGNGDLIVACVAGGDIGLWRITFNHWTRPDGWTFTPPDQRVAVRTPLKPESVTVAMSVSVGGRWKLKIARGDQTVEFEQVEDAWRFKQINPPWPRP